MAASELQDGAESVSTMTEASSAKIDFPYYKHLLHQEYMLQDCLRTRILYDAIKKNCVDFAGKVVVNVGVGSGILSLFAAQAGAKHVYVVEASEMAEYARQLIAGNPSFSDQITVVRGKVEEVELPEKADILIFEPMDFLVLYERMLESYVIARDRFLVSSGKMFPRVGRIHMAPFSDEDLFVEIANKALFWRRKDFFGVDLTSLYESASQSYFSQPVVDAFSDTRRLVAPAICHNLDLASIKVEHLYEIDIPLKFIAEVDRRVHGLACWFDVLFDGSSFSKLLTTAPGHPTYWRRQLLCVLAQPIRVMAGQEITGHLRMVANDDQSYTLYLTLSVMKCAGAEPRGISQTSSGKIELKEPYYRTSQPYLRTDAYATAQDQIPQQLIEEMNQLIVEEPTLRQEDLESSDVIVLQIADDSTLRCYKY